MATIAAVILPDDKKNDGTWNVKIRIGHNAKYRYLDTIHFVSVNQLKKDPKTKKLTNKIKDEYLIALLNPELDAYRKKISTLGSVVKVMNVDELKQALIGDTMEANKINFLNFCLEYIKTLESDGSAKNMGRIVNGLRDYFGSEFIPITDITSNMLFELDKHLRSPRMMTRQYRPGVDTVKTVEGMKDGGVHTFMRDLRGLFKQAVKKYNIPDKGIIVIKHYPFERYKVGRPPITEHRNREVAEMAAIRDIEALTKEQIKEHLIFVKSQGEGYTDQRKYILVGSRSELARDLFMMSFYLCGMNAADMYKLLPGVTDRINYNRSKTKNKRQDNAFFSIKVPEEAKPLLEKYAGTLQIRYSEPAQLNKALDEGLKVITRVLAIDDIDFYDARHTVGDWAGNKCGYSIDKVAELLNQVQKLFEVTYRYVSRNWDLIDEMQEAVINILRNYKQITNVVTTDSKS